jgi:hypothetical protein
MSIENESLLYFNDFEAGDLEGLVEARIDTFQNSAVLGFFNNNGFEVRLSKLPKHNYLAVSFELLIHDTWEGNNTGENGPDLWGFIVDPELEDEQFLQEENAFITSFSNSSCVSSICILQSYPNNFPHPNEPRTGITRSTFGHIRTKEQENGTSIYQITKLIEHNKEKVSIRFKDWTVQTNARYPIADESWSLDNLRIETLRVR